MNSVRFQLAECVGWCINKFSVKRINTSCHNGFRTFFKDTKARPRIFVICNLIVAAFELFFFCTKHPAGILRRTPEPLRWTFFAAMIVEWVMSVFLYWGQKKGSACLCQLWCFGQTCTLIGTLTLILLEEVVLAWLGLALLIIFSVFKLFGLWVIYYYSLECSENRKYSDEYTEDPVAKYSVGHGTKGKPQPVRRDTDQTSVNSTPKNPRHLNLMDADLFDGSHSSNSSPVSPTTQFFNNLGIDFESQPHYSDVMVRKAGTSNSRAFGSTNNIIMSDLMCGGSSTINPNSDE